jgi:hypothetical protein
MLKKFMKASTDTIGTIERTYLGGGIELSTDRTYEDQLQEIANNVGFSVTIIMRNETDKITKDGYYIMNLDKVGNSGTHWTGLIINKNNAYYCDSYGVLPPKEMYNFLLDNFKNVYYNSTQYQDNYSSACGMFVCGFLIFMRNNNCNIKKFNNEFCKMFNYKKLKSNDSLVVKYIKQYLK